MQIFGSVGIYVFCLLLVPFLMVWELLHLTNQQIEYGSFSHYPPLKIHSSYQHFAIYNMFIMLIIIFNLYSYIFYNASCIVTFISMIYCTHNRWIFHLVF